MNDGIYDSWKAKRDYDEWDAPHCYVCTRKFDPGEMKAHIEEHSVKQVIDALTQWSVGSWENEKRIKHERI